MPIYNDNRMFLFYPEFRKLIIDGFLSLIKANGIQIDIIAGTSTAGIPHGAMLADALKLPFIYIREKTQGPWIEKTRLKALMPKKIWMGRKLL